jgi:hypothetical protein
LRRRSAVKDATHSPTQSKLATCLGALRPIITSGDPNAIRLAEAAIDNFLERGPDLNERVNALKQSIRDVGTTNAKLRSLNNSILDYIEKRNRELQPS